MCRWNVNNFKLLLNVCSLLKSLYMQKWNIDNFKLKLECMLLQLKMNIEIIKWNQTKTISNLPTSITLLLQNFQFFPFNDLNELRKVQRDYIWIETW